MEQAPVNVKFRNPTDPPNNWSYESQKWLNLNATEVLIRGKSRRGHPDFFPLTIKAAYVIGIIHDLCSIVDQLLSIKTSRERFYIPAYGIFASGIDLLGRCIQGNSTRNSGIGKGKSDVLAGFKWLSAPDFQQYEKVKPSETLITTSQSQYTIEMLVAMRHFAAHGQGTTDENIYQFQYIDQELLKSAPSLIARGLEYYWNGLRGVLSPDSSEELCNKLAHANIAAFRNQPIYTSWELFSGKDGQGDSITNIFQKFNWS